MMGCILPRELRKIIGMILAQWPIGTLTLTVPNPPIWIRFCTHPRGLGLSEMRYIYYSKEVKGQRKFLYHFCKYVFTCVNIILGGVHFFHQGNKLVSNQKCFLVFSVREPSKNYFVIRRHHFSSSAYIYMHKYFLPLNFFWVVYRYM